MAALCPPPLQITCCPFWKMSSCPEAMDCKSFDLTTTTSCRAVCSHVRFLRERASHCRLPRIGRIAPHLSYNICPEHRVLSLHRGHSVHEFVDVSRNTCLICIHHNYFSSDINSKQLQFASEEAVVSRQRRAKARRFSRGIRVAAAANSTS